MSDQAWWALWRLERRALPFTSSSGNCMTGSVEEPAVEAVGLALTLPFDALRVSWRSGTDAMLEVKDESSSSSSSSSASDCKSSSEWTSLTMSSSPSRCARAFLGRVSGLVAAAVDFFLAAGTDFGLALGRKRLRGGADAGITGLG